MKLVIEIDIDQLPAGVTVPDELGVIIGELREWIEKTDWHEPTARPYRIRNFEGSIIGRAHIA